jgi:hypothetical protein
MPDEPTPEPAATDSPSDDQKERFRAALEAKKSQGGHAGTSHESGGGSGKDHSSRSGGKREFRRKSGG